MLVIKMLQYNRIDVSEGLTFKKISAPKECILCDYWYFKDVFYKFQPCVCNGCHNISMAFEPLEY